jgi:hypothetical protein
MRRFIPVWIRHLATALWGAAALLAQTTNNPGTHWAFEPLSLAEPPRPKAVGWARTVADLWIQDALERAGLDPSPEADRIAWLRRVHFDLTGLPAGSAPGCR